MLLAGTREVFGRLLTFRQYVSLTVEQILLLGFYSVPLVTITGAAAGYVMAMQAGNEIQRFGGTAYIPMLVGITVFRELGPVLASLMLAGRVGSGITAEIASMSVTQQIDALRALSTSPLSTLVVPRVVACAISFPVLTLYADYISVVTAMLYCKQQYGMSYSYYVHGVMHSVTFGDLFTGVGKTFFFGLFVSVAACWKGLNTSGGTKGVGQATTWVVVTSSLAILIGDVVMSKIFLLLGFFR